MRRSSHSVGPILAWAALVGLPAGLASAAGTLPLDQWHPRGEGLAAEAVWGSADGATQLRMRCDRADARILLRIDAPAFPAGLQEVTLVADGVGMAYPMEPTSDGRYVARIALDAPILDRMLVARGFNVAAGGTVVRTGVPGRALSRVVRACRELHWPRAARIESSDAGFAKK